MNFPNSNDIFEKIRIQLKSGNKLYWLIAINVVIFLVIQPFEIVSFLFGMHELKNIILDIFVLPADTNVLLFRPWTILSYMFTQESFWHLLFNMLTLYWFGTIFTQFLSSRRMIHIYLFGGIFGALAYLLSYNIFPAFKYEVPISVLLGASASVLALTFAAATYQPNYSIRMFLLGEIKMKYMALGLLLLDIISIPKGNAGGHIAHIGGAFFGFFYIIMLRKSIDLSNIFNFNIFKRKPKLKVHYKKPVSDEEYVKNKNDKQKQIDIILEKISQNGYDSLTKEEKELLFSASK